LTLCDDDPLSCPMNSLIVRVDQLSLERATAYDTSRLSVQFGCEMEHVAGRV
jgi:hypothetical protein